MSREFYIISNRREAFANLLEQIDSATTSIKVCTYFWLDGEVSDIILQRLWVAACRGIEVDIIIDSKASHFSSVKFKNLANVFNIYKYKGKNFLHSKMWLFDDKNLIITSANISDKNYTRYSDFLSMTNSDTFLPDISETLANRVNQVFDCYMIKSKQLKVSKNLYVPKSISNYEDIKRIFHRQITLTYNKATFLYKKPDIIRTIRTSFNDDGVQLLCGYVNYFILKKLAGDRPYMLHTSLMRELTWIDKIYAFLNLTFLVKKDFVELYYSKIHTKTYLTEKSYITGSYNLDLLSKFNEEILLKLDY